MAVVADLLLASVLTALLSVAGHPDGDAVPRPIPLLFLYATPGLVGACGVIGRRRSLVFAAAAALVPGSLLAFSGVTLVYLLPAALFWAAGVTMPRPLVAARGRLAGLIEVSVTFGLMIGAAMVLFLTTAGGCFTTSDGTVCGDGFLTWPGVALALALDVLAVAFSAWRGLAAEPVTPLQPPA